MRPGETGDADTFPKTSWSLIGRASQGSDVNVRAALNELVNRYLPALRSYLIGGRRLSPDAADDLLQEFMVSKVLEQGWVSRADSEKGKFRSFLLTSLRNFLFDAARASQAKKRMALGGASPADANAVDPADPRVKEPPEAFEEAWAREVIRRATTLMQEQCQAENRADLWTVFEDRLLTPSRDGSPPVPYEVLIPKLGLRSMEQVSNLLVTAKRMFNRNVREAVAEYVGDDQVDQEIYELREALGRASPR